MSMATFRVAKVPAELSGFTEEGHFVQAKIGGLPLYAVNVVGVEGFDPLGKTRRPALSTTTTYVAPAHAAAAGPAAGKPAAAGQTDWF
eukprot:c47453_g1_i1.p1 GENE.c47453_g1_i1~~c47453_g1_i1.p1  ORF type:complete len:101 (+),score=16.04 c47453_g1_i1:41-304(+)